MWAFQTALRDFNTGCSRRSGGHSVAYRATDTDFVAVYIMPENGWFIMPVANVVGRMCLLLRPKGFKRDDPYVHYREAWELLR